MSQVHAYTDDGNLGLVLLVLIVFGLAVIPFTYILRFPFTTPATGFVVLIILAIISGQDSLSIQSSCWIPQLHGCCLLT